VRRRFRSRTFFASPACSISQAAPDASAMNSSTCGSIGNLVVLSPLAARVRMCSKVQLPTAPVGYVGVELGSREIGMPEHFLNRT
jgi:hypothetical protein